MSSYPGCDRLGAGLEKMGALLVLDSADLEYARATGFADLFSILKRHANVIVLGTFSKIHGLTAKKVGYLAARLSLQQVQILDLTSYDLPRHIRITAGTAEQNQRLLDALEKSLAAEVTISRPPVTTPPCVKPSS